MGDIQTRPFSKNYSGLINQSVIALGITVLCVSSHELMKRARRGKHSSSEDLGSRESWEFGYLYQGRCWAKNPSPPSARGWVLSWVKQVLKFPEARMNELRGVDATLYVRFLRGCFWFCLLHTFTTFPILFPIHVEFSEDTVSSKSMTRASISSLVLTPQGLSLLWIHICLLFWITLSWMFTLLWICRGAFNLRAQKIDITKQGLTSPEIKDGNAVYHPHPHPQYAFLDDSSVNQYHPVEGLHLRTVMVSNLPPSLRHEKELKEYFEHYMSRKIDKPSVGLTSSTQPGFINKSLAFIFNRAKRLPVHLPANPLTPLTHPEAGPPEGKAHDSRGKPAITADIPIIERVVIARKMTELASLLERREKILRSLEVAHIKLAKKTLFAVSEAMDRKSTQKPLFTSKNRMFAWSQRGMTAPEDTELGEGSLEQRMELLIQTLGPFVEEFGLKKSHSLVAARRQFKTPEHISRRLRTPASDDSDDGQLDTGFTMPSYPPPSNTGWSSRPQKTIWDALLSLPRDCLDAYQPLISLSHVFRGQTVPSIDYYTTKLNLLTSLITENRAKAINDFYPVSTAFVTFEKPSEARKACKYLAVHPNNPLACLVTMAPQYQDLDWMRVMKSSFNAEFVKDWVVNLGVWAFTVFWLFPVSLLVGLVSIQNISLFWPGLKAYLDRHPWQEEVIQSFLPTLLVALLALLIPLILLLIAKKAHTITTLSALHDRILTRYYKFLVVNVLVFFCVGTAALQSFLQSFKATTHPDVLRVVADSFPTAGPFYVGWLIFTTAIHAGFELALLGLPLILYPGTRRSVTPRKRTVRTRPRTFNFYYWLPNHLLVLHVLLLFSILNPFVIPFATVYYFVEIGVVKNQLIYVYAKNYEGNGQVVLIRIVRYSLDGLLLSQAVFLAYMVVLKKGVNVGLSAFLIVLTALVKIFMTRMCRTQFEHDDIMEAEVICGEEYGGQGETETGADASDQQQNGAIGLGRPYPSLLTWRLSDWAKIPYKTIRHHQHPRRQPNPFGPRGQAFSRLSSMSLDQHQIQRAMTSKPSSATTGQTLSPEVSRGQAQSPPVPDHPDKCMSEYSELVVPHPPPVPWDDETTCDLPYDNPFYTRTISNSLWLPRDPFVPVNLDDTIDLKTSLTVEPSAGQIGTWLGVPESSSPRPIIRTLSVDSSPEATPPLPVPTSPYTGQEEIDLPFAIAKRVRSRDADIELASPPRRPTSSRRKVSGGDLSVGEMSRKRLSVTDRPPLVTYRSFSAGTAPTRGRSSSVLSTLEPPLPMGQSRSVDELGIRADAQSQAEFVASPSTSSLAPPQAARARNISTHQAVVYEVVVEEEQALANRIEDENAEAAKAASTKSWLISWMFKKQTPA